MTTHAGDMTGLATAAHRDLTAILTDVRHLVELETPSDAKALLDAGLDGIETWLTTRLGHPHHRTRHPGGDHGDVLEVTYPGTTPATVLLCCHYDTVWPHGTLAQWPVTTTDDRLSGPGCFDMKAGIVHGVWALRILRELDLPRPTVRLLLNGDEEIGSPASRPHIESASADATLTLVLEPSRAGKVKTTRKGMGLFDIATHGIESHAGLDPDAGASAIHALAALVPTITALARPDTGTTVNVGTITGGTGRNVVAGHAACQIDVRVQAPDEMARIDSALATLTSPDPRVKVEVTGEWNRPPMNPNPATERMLRLARGVAADLGSDLDAIAVGGASDGNFISALGRPVLDGMGAVGAGPHSRDEHLTIAGTPHQVALLAGLLARL